MPSSRSSRKPVYKGFPYPNPMADTYRCVKVTIPDSQEDTAALIAALDYLTKWVAWRPQGNMEEVDQAQLWKHALNVTLDTIYDDCDQVDPGCIDNTSVDLRDIMLLRQSTTNPCIIEYSLNNIDWCVLYDASLCSSGAALPFGEEPTLPMEPIPAQTTAQSFVMYLGDIFVTIQDGIDNTETDEQIGDKVDVMINKLTKGGSVKGAEIVRGYKALNTNMKTDLQSRAFWDSVNEPLACALNALSGGIADALNQWSGELAGMLNAASWLVGEVFPNWWPYGGPSSSDVVQAGQIEPSGNFSPFTFSDCFGTNLANWSFASLGEHTYTTPNDFVHSGPIYQYQLGTYSPKATCELCVIEILSVDDLSPDGYLQVSWATDPALNGAFGSFIPTAPGLWYSLSDNTQYAQPDQAAVEAMLNDLGQTLGDMTPTIDHSQYWCDTSRGWTRIGTRGGTYGPGQQPPNPGFASISWRGWVYMYSR